MLEVGIKIYNKKDYEDYDFSNKELNNLSLNYCGFYSTNFHKSTIIGSEFHSCNFQYSKFNKTTIQNTKIKKCDFRGADLSSSYLKSVDLTGCNFWDSSLTDTTFENVFLMDVIGNGKEIKSFQLGLFTVVYTWDMLQVGCKIRPIAEWDNFVNRDILEMGGREAAKFWFLYKPYILDIIQISPATKPKKLTDRTKP